MFGPTISFLVKTAAPVLVMAGLLAGCTAQTDTAANLSLSATAAAGSETVNDNSPLHSTCAKPIFTSRKGALVAGRTNPGDRYYIEFRLRQSLAIPSGHMYVTYGRLDESGKPVTAHYTGLFPKGNVAGLYAGIVLPVALPAELEPSSLDCNLAPASAYRRSLNEAQYRAVLRKVEDLKRRQPKWQMLAYNCNHYVTEIGMAAGMNPVPGAKAGQFLSAQYFGAFVRSNGDQIDDRRVERAMSR